MLTLTLEVALCPACTATSPQYHGLSLLDSNRSSKWKDTTKSDRNASPGVTYGSNESKETGNGSMY